MTAPYKKRAKAGWNNDKEQSNKDERAYIKTELSKELLTSSEIEKFITEDETISSQFDEISTRAKNKAKKKVLKAKDIRNKIRDCERKIEFFSSGRLYKSTFTNGIVTRYNRELESLKQELTELENK